MSVQVDHIIHFNSGHCTYTFKVCTLYIRSLLNPLEVTSSAVLAKSNPIDLFALTETRITSLSTLVEITLANATPIRLEMLASSLVKRSLRHLNDQKETLNKGVK